MADKKAALLVAALPPPDKLKGGSGGASAPASDDGPDGKAMAFDDFWSAVEAKDKDGARGALEDLIRMCMSEY